jgi:hypothetical protein
LLIDVTAERADGLDARFILLEAIRPTRTGTHGSTIVEICTAMDRVRTPTGKPQLRGPRRPLIDAAGIVAAEGRGTATSDAQCGRRGL